MKGINLTRQSDGRRLFVNMEPITVMVHCEDNTGTMIYFAGDDHVKVVESIDDILLGYCNAFEPELMK